MNILTRHSDWLVKTQELYNQILEFYYNLYLDTFQDGRPGSMEALRTLEKLTIPGRDRQPVQYPLPWQKVPLYFRRAAINSAIAATSSYLSREKQKIRSTSFTESVTCYKGMYRDFEGNAITLKVWTGEKWLWNRIKLRGNTIPEEGQMMSPSIVLKKTGPELHIPWKTFVKDGRTAKERMAEGTNLCSVRFTNTDTFAVCCILDEQGNQLAVHTCRGGDAYRHRCKLLETRIQKSRPNTVGDNSPQPNRKYYMHLKNLSEHYAHQVSREILNFCKENQAGIIVLPDYDQNFTRMAMVKSGNFSPLHLSSKIRTNLQYKAWAEGILVLETRTDGLKDKCAICGGKVRRKGNEFLCENGHQGNRFLNDARNLGRKCQDSFFRGSRTK